MGRTRHPVVAAGVVRGAICEGAGRVCWGGAVVDRHVPVAKDEAIGYRWGRWRLVWRKGGLGGGGRG